MLEASVAAQQVFVRASRWREDNPAAGEIIVPSGTAAGRLEATHVPIDNASGHSATIGERFAFVDCEGTAFIFDASDPETTAAS